MISVMNHDHRRIINPRGRPAGVCQPGHQVSLWYSLLKATEAADSSRWSPHSGAGHLHPEPPPRTSTKKLRGPTRIRKEDGELQVPAEELQSEIQNHSTRLKVCGNQLHFLLRCTKSKPCVRASWPLLPAAVGGLVAGRLVEAAETAGVLLVVGWATGGVNNNRSPIAANNLLIYVQAETGNALNHMWGQLLINKERLAGS